MELPLAPLFPLFFSIFFLFFLLRRKAQGGKNLPPSPWRLPIIGNLHQLSSNPQHTLIRLSQKYGGLMFLQLGSVPTLVVSSSEALKSIFKTHDVAFSNRAVFQAIKKVAFGSLTVSFAPYGETWRQGRKLCVLHLLCSKRVRALRGVREQEVSNLVAAVRKLSPLVDLSSMVFALSSNVACRAVFGEKHSGGEGVYEGSRSWLHGIVKEAQDLAVAFCFEDFFKGMGWVDFLSGQRKRVEKTAEKLNAFFQRVIEEHQERVKQEEDEEEVAEDFVEVLLRELKNAPNGGFLESMDNVKAIMGDLFFASSETTSATIIWAMTELIRNPTIMRKSQRELRDAFGYKNKIQETDLEQLEYLKFVIKETLRLHPPVPLLLPRETIEPCRIQDYDIPAKTRVLVNTLAIAKDPKVWDSPERFWPERFRGRSGMDLKGGPEFDFVPFGVGRRSCPGTEFAAVVVELVLANLLHCFEWELPDGVKPEEVDIEEAAGLAVHKKVPLRLVAKPKV
ncbi:hypothetical protein HPP92_010657 [Vanilla planifolia]|uniref:Cytochrome P450 n=1 Tax=Vanilla planifolia TaxID=51239 RepID=A0A835UXS0_VANPL|nr:hypothetical protein HPP92_010657 [Vanilla planifolia]